MQLKSSLHLPVLTSNQVIYQHTIKPFNAINNASLLCNFYPFVSGCVWVCGLPASFMFFHVFCWRGCCKTNKYSNIFQFKITVLYLNQCFCFPVFCIFLFSVCILNGCYSLHTCHRYADLPLKDIFLIIIAVENAVLFNELWKLTNSVFSGLQINRE